MTRTPQDLPDDPRDAAAYWFARVHSGSFGAAEQAAFAQWRQADERHEQEYRALDFLWQASQRVPDDELRAMLRHAQAQDAVESAPVSVQAAGRPLPEPTRTSVRMLAACGWRGMAVACGVVLMLGAGAVLVHLNTPEFVADYATAAGELRRETLPDGSVVTLNTRSHLTVHYYPNRRGVQLAQGEALFEVAGDAERPFTVVAADVRVRVTGTRFAVRQYEAGAAMEAGAAAAAGAGVAVAVQSGSVAVSSGPWWRFWEPHATALGADQRTLAGQGEVQGAQAADVDTLTAWREGKVVFRDQPLEHVVTEMNRYLQQPVRLADRRLRQQRVSGVFNVRSADEFLKVLRNTLPVAVQLHPDGSVDLRSR